VQTYGCILVTALFLSAMGLAVSTVMRRSVPALLLAYGLVAALIVGSGAAEIALHVFSKDFEGVVFIYLNPFTPLVLNLYEESIDPVLRHLYWWITPLVELGLGLICTAVAALRIRTMRE
jgi:hypothetical protein